MTSPIQSLQALLALAAEPLGHRVGCPRTRSQPGLDSHCNCDFGKRLVAREKREVIVTNLLLPAVEALEKCEAELRDHVADVDRLHKQGESFSKGIEIGKAENRLLDLADKLRDTVLHDLQEAIAAGEVGNG